MEKHFANLLAGRRAPGFARDRYGNAMPTQCSRQFLDLRALAAAVETFKSNKFSARRHFGMIAGGVVDRRRGLSVGLGRDAGRAITKIWIRYEAAISSSARTSSIA